MFVVKSFYAVTGSDSESDGDGGSKKEAGPSGGAARTHSEIGDIDDLTALLAGTVSPLCDSVKERFDIVASRVWRRAKPPEQREEDLSRINALIEQLLRIRIALLSRPCTEESKSAVDLIDKTIKDFMADPRFRFHFYKPELGHYFLLTNYLD